MTYSRQNLFLSIILLVSIAMLACLIFAGRWQLDEFKLVASYRELGFGAFTERVLGWSPRPLSELALYVYSSLVLTTGNQLISEFLFFNWTIILFGTILPVFFVSPSMRSAALVLQLSLCVFCIYGLRNSDILFWTMAAAAYLPTMAGLFVAVGMTTLTSMDKPKQVGVLVGALTIAALSSEFGTFFSLAFSSLVLIFWTASKFLDRQISLPLKSAFFPVAAIAILVIFGLYFGRVESFSEAIFSDPTKSGNIFSAIYSAFHKVIVGLFFFSDTTVHQQFLWFGLPTKLVLFLGLFVFFLNIFSSPGGLLISTALLISSLFASFMIVVGQHYRFGGACCDRYGTMETAYEWAAIFALAKISAVVASTLWPHLCADNSRRLRFSTIAVALSALVPVTLIAPDLLSDLNRMTEIQSAQDSIWQTGNEPGTPIVIEKSTPGRVLAGGSTYIADGVYDELSAPWTVKIIMEFFDKDLVIAKTL